MPNTCAAAPEAVPCCSVSSASPAGMQVIAGTKIRMARGSYRYNPRVARPRPRSRKPATCTHSERIPLGNLHGSMPYCSAARLGANQHMTPSAVRPTERHTLPTWNKMCATPDTERERHDFAPLTFHSQSVSQFRCGPPALTNNHSLFIPAFSLVDRRRAARPVTVPRESRRRGRALPQAPPARSPGCTQAPAPATARPPRGPHG